MKKKLIYIVLIAFIFVVGMNAVSASGFSSDVRYNVCGINNVPENVPMLTSGLYNLIKIAVPIIIIVMGIVDLVGAVSAADIDKMKKSQKKLITRLIAGVFIFLIMAIVQFIFKKVDRGETGFWNCMNCILSNNCDSSISSKQSYTPCATRGQSTCISEGDSDAYGHKCLLKGQNCIDDCSSYTSNTCPTNYCQWIRNGSDPLNGVCKQK